MRNALFFIILVFVVNALQAQIDSTKTFESCRGKLPLPLKHFENIIINEKPQKLGCYWSDDTSIAFICNSQDSIFAVFEGEIVAVTDSDSVEYGILIKTGKYFLYYESIAKLTCKRNDFVKMGQHIGYLVTNFQDKYLVRLRLYDDKMRLIQLCNWFKVKQQRYNKAPQRTERTSVRRNNS